MADTNGLSSYKLSAALLKEDDGNKKLVLKFQPTGRAESIADALVNATKEHREEGKVVKVDLKHTEVDYGDGLSLNIAYISSKSVCQTCGASRAEPTEWCNDEEGCGKFRNEEVVVKARPDASAQMAKMAALLE